MFCVANQIGIWTGRQKEVVGWKGRHQEANTDANGRLEFIPIAVPLPFIKCSRRLNAAIYKFLNNITKLPLALLSLMHTDLLHSLTAIGKDAYIRRDLGETFLTIKVRPHLLYKASRLSLPHVGAPAR